MEYHDLHISSFDWCNGIAISARAHDKTKQQGEMVQFNQERMIVLGLRSILLTYSEQDYMLLFQPSFFTVTPDHF